MDLTISILPRRATQLKNDVAVTPKHEHGRLHFNEISKHSVFFEGLHVFLGRFSSLNVNGLEHIVLYISMAGRSKTSSEIPACVSVDSQKWAISDMQFKYLRYVANDQDGRSVFGELVHFGTAVAHVVLLTVVRKIQDPISESKGDPQHSICILM